jgi:hypothetical protein
LGGRFVLLNESKAMKVYCKTCGTQLTPELKLYTGNSFGEADVQPYVQQGYYVISDGEFFTDTIGTVIINIADLLNAKNHTNPGRLNGCCGLDGCDGFNKVCINGHEVATEKSDCWMPHAIFFEKDKISLK